MTHECIIIKSGFFFFNEGEVRVIFRILTRYSKRFCGKNISETHHWSKYNVYTHILKHV